MNKGKCCFFGHRKLSVTPELVERITKEIESLIVQKGVDTFYFGSKSDFDTLCLDVVTDLKKKYPHICRVYVRAAFPDICDSYEGYLLQRYDSTYFAEKIRGAGKASYVERNQDMINQSDYCIVYYDPDYLPPRRRNAKRDFDDYQPKSGTSLAYEYAVKKEKEIINTFCNQPMLQQLE